jgi:hypothetical protein
MEAVMSPSRFNSIVLLLLLAPAAGGSGDAAAQIGRIKKAVADKAADAGKKSACIPERPPAFVKTVGLSAAQIAKINQGLDAEIQRTPAARAEYEQRLKQSDQETQAYQKAHAAWEKKNEQYQACADKVREADAKKSDALRGRVEASGDKTKGAVDTTQMMEMAKKAQAAAERVTNGTATAADRQTLAEFQRMMAGVQASAMQTGAAMQEAQAFDQEAEARVEKACGKKPEEPKAPAMAGPTPERAGQEAGAKAAGMDVAAYASARETLIALVMSNTVVKADGSSQGAQAEADAINSAIQEAAKKVCDMKKAGVPT